MERGHVVRCQLDTVWAMCVLLLLWRKRQRLPSLAADVPSSSSERASGGSGDPPSSANATSHESAYEESAYGSSACAPMWDSDASAATSGQTWNGRSSVRHREEEYSERQGRRGIMNMPGTTSWSDDP